MLCKKNEKLESRNFVDGVDFTKDDPCIFVVYPAGAAGDLLISIIDKHYLRTGCEYYGIDDNGRVKMFTTDYEKLDLDYNYQFDQQFFWDLAKNLGNRNLNYSLLDQVIFGCHMWEDKQVEYILKTFPKAKVIRIFSKDDTGFDLISSLKHIKCLSRISNKKSHITLTDSPRVLEIPFGALFNETNYLKYYDKIIKFLNLNGRLICFDYVQYYLTRQDLNTAKLLEEYSQTL
tara:strand:- start:102 stop:797 length:696 start_codon:yes stop_codon:yes gene_type:complete